MLQTMKNLVLLISFVLLFGCADDNDISVSSESIGIGGSTARFTIVGDHLYIVTESDMKLIDVSDATNPSFKSSVNIGRDIETIFPYKNHLFIGSAGGVFIYNIDDPASPSFVSGFSHSLGCDPVIANDNYAYVTVREGTACRRDLIESNNLITLDISNISNPVETSNQWMINPRGLTFFKGELYVAEGASGMKRFNLEDPARPVLEKFYADIPANDMIGLDDVMIITRDEGIFQYGCIQDSIQYLSTIL
jgi:hypothetical protein